MTQKGFLEMATTDGSLSGSLPCVIVVIVLSIAAVSDVKSRVWRGRAALSSARYVDNSIFRPCQGIPAATDLNNPTEPIDQLTSPPQDDKYPPVDYLIGSSLAAQERLCLLLSMHREITMAHAPIGVNSCWTISSTYSLSTGG